MAGAAGNKIVPDLATTVPKPTNGGKTYTFHLKPDIKFGPPVNREVTSQDFLYAMERLANPKDGGGVRLLLHVDQGLERLRRRQGEDDLGHRDAERETIVFNLTKPTVTSSTGWRCRRRARCRQRSRSASRASRASTARTLISSGPYMIQGIDKIDDLVSARRSSRSSGFDGSQTSTTSSATRTTTQATRPATRKNYPDEFTVHRSTRTRRRHLNQIEAGQLDTATSSLPPDVLAEVLDEPSLKRSTSI